MTDKKLRLTQIGPIERPDHYHLGEGHSCYFLGEYTPYQSWDYSTTNRLIGNLKKGMERRGERDWHYKEKAITAVGNYYATAWNWPVILQKHRPALIPVPPSKAKTDRLYDPRMLEVLRHMERAVGQPLDIRDCLSFDGSLPASHIADQRPTIDRLTQALRVDIPSARPAEQPGLLFVFDDVLTTGAHFVAVARKLGEFFPGVPVVGNFVARRRIANPFEDD